MPPSVPFLTSSHLSAFDINRCSFPPIISFPRQFHQQMPTVMRIAMLLKHTACIKAHSTQAHSLHTRYILLLLGDGVIGVQIHINKGRAGQQCVSLNARGPWKFGNLETWKCQNSPKSAYAKLGQLSLKIDSVQFSKTNRYQPNLHLRT